MSKDQNAAAVVNTMDIIGDLDAGVFGDKVAMALDEAGVSAVATGKKPQVTIVLDVERHGDTRHVQVHHTIKTKTPTMTGHVLEEDKKKTSLYICSNKEWSFQQEEQGQFEFQK